MYLFGWRKRISLILCTFLFLGSISYLSGTIYQGDKKLNRDWKGNYLTSSFFNNSSPLKLFNSIFKVSLSIEGKEDKEKNDKSSYIFIERSNLLSQIKEIIKKQILKKLFILKPEFKYESKDLIGNIFYKWVSENKLWVIIKFKLDIFDSKNWFYDNFSVIINK